MRRREILTTPLLLLAAAAVNAGCSSSRGAGAVPAVTPNGTAALPGGTSGISFDDLRYSVALQQVVAPAAQSGNLDLVDPVSLAITSVAGVSADTADEGGGFVFAIDRAGPTLYVIDPSAHTVVATTALSSFPDYLRYVALTNEVWISDRGDEQIDVLTLGTGAVPAPVHVAFIPTPGAPEGLTIDATRHQAYVHKFQGALDVIDLASRTVTATWPTGCISSHGIPAVDEARGFVFATCSTPEVHVLDLANGGAQLDSYRIPSGNGDGLPSYSSSLHHLYLRGDPGDTVAILGVSAQGTLALLANAATASAGHCLVADDHDDLWVCDEQNGRLLRFKDDFAVTP